MFSCVELLLEIAKLISNKADGNQIVKTFTGEFRPTLKEEKHIDFTKGDNASSLRHLLGT